MKPLTREWVDKAEGDRNTARRELRARKNPNFDAACFHAQQCAEKYLKALLQESGLAITRTHSLDALARPLIAAASVSSLLPALRTLSAYAVETRYPGKNANRSLAREAVLHMERVRRGIRGILKLPK